MKTAIHAVLMTSIGILCLGFDCKCPFDQIYDFEVRAISPADGVVIYESEVLLVWSYIYTGGGYIEYHSLYTGTVRDSLEYIWETSEDTDTVYLFGSLEPATTYYWQVFTGEDDDGKRKTRATDIRSFTTYDVFMDTGGLYHPTPEHGAIGVSINPAFAWENYNPDVIPYDFDIYLGTTADPPLLASGLSAPWYSLTNDTLEYITRYYWRVEAVYGADTITGPLWEFTTNYPGSADIFALIEIDARQAPSGYHVMEEIRIRLDSTQAIAAPVVPLEADSVLVEGVKLDWNALDQNYSFTEWSFPFIENGQPVDIDIFGNSDVPTMNIGPVFPACTLGITSPESFESVSISGFEVAWDGSECGGTVWLTLMSGNDSTGVWKETANDGSDSLTATDLLPLGGQTGTYNLIIIKQAEENIMAPGYFEESLFRARAYNVMEQIIISMK